MPLGFIGFGSAPVLTREPEAEEKFDELYVRSETGLGAENGLTVTGRAPGSRDGDGDGDGDRPEPAPLAASGTT